MRFGRRRGRVGVTRRTLNRVNWARSGVDVDSRNAEFLKSFFPPLPNAANQVF